MRSRLTLQRPVNFEKTSIQVTVEAEQWQLRYHSTLGSKTSSPFTPLNPPQLLRTLKGADAIPRHNLTALQTGECKIERRGEEVISLFEIEPADLDRGLLSLRTEIRSQDLVGHAWLELTCGYPDRRSQVREIRYQENRRSTDWKFADLSQFLRKDQRPSLIRLCLVTEGPGTIWIRNTQAIVTPF